MTTRMTVIALSTVCVTEDQPAPLEYPSHPGAEDGAYGMCKWTKDQTYLCFASRDQKIMELPCSH